LFCLVWWCQLCVETTIMLLKTFEGCCVHLGWTSCVHFKSNGPFQTISIRQIFSPSIRLLGAQFNFLQV
jgi:hypothetical protein